MYKYNFCGSSDKSVDGYNGMISILFLNAFYFAQK